MPIVPFGVKEWGFTAITLSVIGIVYASIIAINQKDFKRLIAYASIAHVGLISAGLLTSSRLGMQGALIQMIKPRNLSLCIILYLRDHFQQIQYQNHYFIGWLEDKCTNTDDGFCYRYSRYHRVAFYQRICGRVSLAQCIVSV